MLEVILEGNEKRMGGTLDKKSMVFKPSKNGGLKWSI